MAVITITPNTLGATVLTRNTLTASDTVAYVKGQNMQLCLANNTAGSLTATLVGSTAAATYVVAGTGGALLSPPPSAGKAIAVAANSTVEVSLDDLELYLQGVITVTGGAGLIATVVSN